MFTFGWRGWTMLPVSMWAWLFTHLPLSQQCHLVRALWRGSSSLCIVIRHFQLLDHTGKCMKLLQKIQECWGTGGKEISEVVFNSQLCLTDVSCFHSRNFPGFVLLFLHPFKYDPVKFEQCSLHYTRLCCVKRQIQMTKRLLHTSPSPLSALKQQPLMNLKQMQAKRRF